MLLFSIHKVILACLRGRFFRGHGVLLCIVYRQCSVYSINYCYCV